MRVKYTPSHKMSYGYFKCEECGSEFYGGFEPAIHKKSCTKTDYTSCIYHYGDKEIESIKEYIKLFGYEQANCGITKYIIKEENL